MAFTMRDLATPEGVAHLVAVTGGTQSPYNHPQQADGVLTVAQQAIQMNPNLAAVKVRIMPNLPNAFYNYDKGELLLGITNPAALAHEIEHANNIKQEGLYRRVLRTAQGISRVNNVMALPTVLALRAFIQDRQRRDDILKTLSALSAAVAAPTLMEEAAASMQAARTSPFPMEAMKTLGPAFLAHVASSLKPALAYQAGRL